MKPSWRSAVGIAFSAVLLWWTLRDVSLAVVWHELAQSSIPLFLGSALCATLIFPLRAFRWRTILQPVAPNQPFGALWRSIAIGMMANNVLPARAGEIARAYALTKQTKVPFATSIASLAVDRLFDMVVLLLLGGAAFFDPQFPPSIRHWLARPFGRVFFAGEHTSFRWQGYMNGAVETGLRAAAEIAARTRD